MIELCGQLFPRTVHPVAFIREGCPVCLVTIPKYFLKAGVDYVSKQRVHFNRVGDHISCS